LLGQRAHGREDERVRGSERRERDRPDASAREGERGERERERPRHRHTHTHTNTQAKCSERIRTVGPDLPPKVVCPNLLIRLGVVAVDVVVLHRNSERISNRYRQPLQRIARVLHLDDGRAVVVREFPVQRFDVACAAMTSRSSGAFECTHICASRMCTFTHAHARAHARTQARTHTHTHAHTHTHTHTHTHHLLVCVHAGAHLQASEMAKRRHSSFQYAPPMLDRLHTTHRHAVP